MTENSQVSLRSGFIRLEQAADGRIWQVVLARPKQKNALNLAMYTDLAEVIAGFEANGLARVLVVAADGDSFCSGNDLADFAAAESQELITTKGPLGQFMVALRDCSKPVFAVVEGVAVGIGTTMLLHMDAVFACSKASFCLPFAKLGLCPEFASSLLLAQRAGELQARRWLYSGETFSAEDALAGGIISELGDNPMQKALDYAEDLCAIPQQALVTTKRLAREPMRSAIEAAMAREAETFITALQGDEFKQAVTAFFNRK